MVDGVIRVSMEECDRKINAAPWPRSQRVVLDRDLVLQAVRVEGQEVLLN